MEQNQENVLWKMNKNQTKQYPSTEDLIESLHADRKKHRLVLNPQFLDDEKLPEDERTMVLHEIFKRNIREKQLSRIISHLTPILDGVHPPSALIYGPTGSGKTVSLLHVLSSFKNVTDKNKIKFNFVYIDLTSPSTLFGALNKTARALDDSCRRYRKGIPIEYMQETICTAIEDYKGFLCLLIDEADNVKPNVDEFLTFLVKTLPRKVQCKIILLLLTNRLDWEKTLDPRILSFLKKTDIIFEPYDAMDLLEILNLRVQRALDSKKVDEAALKKIAAYASRENGDARRAIELLVSAVKVAEDGKEQLTTDYVDVAEANLEKDKSEALINALATHQRLALEACYLAMKTKRTECTNTGDAYHFYKNICHNDSIKSLSQRRFSDLLSAIDLYGLVNCRLISKGRYGQTRQISAALPDAVIKKIVGNR